MSALRSVAAAAKKLVQVQHASIAVPINVQVVARLLHRHSSTFSDTSKCSSDCAWLQIAPNLSGFEKDKSSPQVTKQADQLAISGPLGTNRTCLRKLDSLGVAAVRLAPESRSIDVCSPDKEFFGTIQVPGPLKWHPAGLFYMHIAIKLQVLLLAKLQPVLSEPFKLSATSMLSGCVSYAEPAEEQDTRRDAWVPGVPAHGGHWLPCVAGGPGALAPQPLDIIAHMQMGTLHLAAACTYGGPVVPAGLTSRCRFGTWRVASCHNTCVLCLLNVCLQCDCIPKDQDN